MIPLGLSAADLERRRKYVCASDVAPIMRGEWRKVWLEKTGRAEPEDLSGKLPVQMGSYTEPFNLWWCHQQERRYIEYFSGNPLMRVAWNELVPDELPDARSDEFQVSQEYPWMACSLDALSATRQGHLCVLDAKHVGQFRYDELVQRYTPACTHQAIVMGRRWWALSVLIGNGKWEWIEQEIDPWYESQVIAETRAFWDWVERDEEPIDKTEPEPPPKPTPRLRSVDLNRDDPNWKADLIALAREFISTEPAFRKHMIVRDQIKGLIPADVGSVEWGIFHAKRTRADALVITVEKEKADGIS